MADIALWQRVESDQPGGRPVWSIFLSPASGTLVDRDADLEVRGLAPTPDAGSRVG